MNGPGWYERAEDELVNDLNNGLMSRAEFDTAMRDLNYEIRSAAEEEAQSAYDNYMGGY